MTFKKNDEVAAVVRGLTTFLPPRKTAVFAPSIGEPSTIISLDRALTGGVVSTDLIRNIRTGLSGTGIRVPMDIVRVIVPDVTQAELLMLLTLGANETRFSPSHQSDSQWPVGFWQFLKSTYQNTIIKEWPALSLSTRTSIAAIAAEIDASDAKALLEDSSTLMRLSDFSISVVSGVHLATALVRSRKLASQLPSKITNDNMKRLYTSLALNSNFSKQLFALTAFWVTGLGYLTSSKTVPHAERFESDQRMYLSLNGINLNDPLALSTR